jgi:hypothetical protein
VFSECVGEHKKIGEKTQQKVRDNVLDGGRQFSFFSIVVGDLLFLCDCLTATSSRMHVVDERDLLWNSGNMKMCRGRNGRRFQFAFGEVRKFRRDWERCRVSRRLINLGNGSSRSRVHRTKEKFRETFDEINENF